MHRRGALLSASAPLVVASALVLGYGLDVRLDVKAMSWLPQAGGAPWVYPIGWTLYVLLFLHGWLVAPFAAWLYLALRPGRTAQLPDPSCRSEPALGR